MIIGRDGVGVGVAVGDGDGVAVGDGVGVASGGVVGEEVGVSSGTITVPPFTITGDEPEPLWSIGVSGVVAPPVVP